MRIYIGNLNTDTAEEDLRDLFASHGTVESVVLKSHHRTGESLRFGLIEMPDQAEAELAIRKLDGSEFLGRPIKVMPAFVRPEPPSLPESN